MFPPPCEAQLIAGMDVGREERGGGGQKEREALLLASPGDFGGFEGRGGKEAKP